MAANNYPSTTCRVPAPTPATLGLIARLARGPVALAGLRDQDAMRALVIAQARGAARLVLAGDGTAVVTRGGVR